MALDPRKDVDIHSPSLLPDGRGVLFVRHPADQSARPVQFWNGSEATTLVAGQGAVGSSGVATLGSPVYSPTGHVLFEMNGGVWAVPFSTRSAQATGDPFLVADAARSPSVADDGVVVMLSGRPTTSLRLTWVDRSGKPGGHISEKRGAGPQISPDGRLAAVTVGFGAGADIWLIDLVRGVERRLTFESSADTQASWSPDGKTLVYGCGLSICARAADGTRESVELVQNARNAAVSPDGRYLVFIREDGPTAGICAQELGPAGLSSKPKGEPRVVIAPRAPGSFEISPDGRYLAYSSKDNGSDGVFVTTFPVPEGRWEIPVRAAVEPRWDPRGERLYVVDDLTRIVEVPVDLKGVFTAGRPEAPMPRLGTQRRIGYDVSKTGSFLVPVTPVDESQAHILMIRNWKPR